MPCVTGGLSTLEVGIIDHPRLCVNSGGALHVPFLASGSVLTCVHRLMLR